MVAFFFIQYEIDKISKETMRTILYIIFFYVGIANIFAQDSLLVGRKYFEDQLYVGITYNILNHKPLDLQQRGISNGLNTGFIKDFPLNKKGTFAFGIGLGYSYNKFSQNLKIQNQTPEFVLVENEYETNKFELHAIEIPVEIRVFRSSSPTITKFLRIYLGGKVSYIFQSKSKYTSSNENLKITPLPYINKWQYGPYLAIGWGPWNLYTYYDLDSIFVNAPQTETINPNQLKSIKIGLQFYIF